jgi:molecular chaperone DnaK
LTYDKQTKVRAVDSDTTGVAHLLSVQLSQPGIDFGTTKTMISRWDPQSGRPEIVFGGGSLPLIPAAIHIDHTGRMEFGQDAVDQSEHDPSGYFPDLKRHLGIRSPLIIHGRSYTIVQLCSEFLGWLKKQIEEQVIFEKIDRAVITVPALYGKVQRDDLLASANACGLTAELLDEPLAAGLAFLDQVQHSRLDDNILVVDWGGGTLDLVVLDRSDGAITLHSDLVGGRSFLLNTATARAAFTYHA